MNATRTVGHTLETILRDAGVEPASESCGVRKYWIADVLANCSMANRAGLLSAHRAGALVLGRADLMPHWRGIGAPVDASELEPLPGVRLHFLVVRD